VAVRDSLDLDGNLRSERALVQGRYPLKYVKLAASHRNGDRRGHGRNPEVRRP
jgi:hypothetical protein